jgi:hypothetical protein
MMRPSDPYGLCDHGAAKLRYYNEYIAISNHHDGVCAHLPSRDLVLKPLLMNHEEAIVAGSLNMPAGTTSAPPPMARVGGPFNIKCGIWNWTELEKVEESIPSWGSS